ncbi:MAG: beta-ketoacyl synthase N-terminal-like domain-containing protein [Planctomycetota bacterium]
MTSNSRRVVITGMGLITPLGISLDSVVSHLREGRSGIAMLERVPSGNLPSDIAGEVRDFNGNIAEFGDSIEKKTKRNIKKGLKLMCREIQMGVAAAQRALIDAGLSSEETTPDNRIYDPERIGTMFGSDYIVTEPDEFTVGVRNCMDDEGKFNFEDWSEKGLTAVEPLWLLKYLPNMPASHVAIYNDLRGPSNSITVREAGANLALAEAVTTIRRGAADIMVAGATGSKIQSLRTIHVSLQEQLADRHKEPANGEASRASRPFDMHRTGAVLAEGAGVLILEDMEYAQNRNAGILGEIIGYSSSSVASTTGVADYQTAFENVIDGALETSGLEASEIGHIHAHGLGTLQSDRDEARAIASRFNGTPVVAAKSYSGNMGGGSGMLEVATSLHSIRAGNLFKTLNYETADPDCPVNVVTDDSTPSGDCFLNLNITPQGQASAVVVRTV